MKKVLLLVFLLMLVWGCQDVPLSTPQPTQTAVSPTASPPSVEATVTAVSTTETPDLIDLALTAAAATEAAQAAATPTPEATVAITMSPEVEAYLNDAIAIIQENALFADRLDWEKMKTAAFIGSNYATQTEQTYPSLRFILTQLGDNHSFLLTPDEADYWLNATVDDNPAVTSDIVAERLGYIHIPGFISSDEDAMVAHATNIQFHIRQLADQQPCGWIVDLRDNTGGNMHPMLAGLAPLLGDGTLGYFLSPNADPVAWGIADGQVVLGENPVMLLEQPLVLEDGQEMPVAILMGPVTASSGEAVVISFIGRSQTRLFGNPTFGVSTANEGFTLSDGAMLILTISVMADREQTPFGEEITPDEIVTDEAVLETAVAWLWEQPGCSLP